MISSPLIRRQISLSRTEISFVDKDRFIFPSRIIVSLSQITINRISLPPSNPAAGDDAFPSNGSVRKRTAAQPPPEPRKFRSMEEIMRVSNPSPSVTGDYYSDLRCEECRSSDGEHEMLLCDNCDRGYHLFCLRPIVVRVPAGSWICLSCVGSRPLRRFPLAQTKIRDFFRIWKCSNSNLEEKCRTSQDTM